MGFHINLIDENPWLNIIFDFICASMRLFLYPFPIQFKGLMIRRFVNRMKSMSHEMK